MFARHTLHVWVLFTLGLTSGCTSVGTPDVYFRRGSEDAVRSIMRVAILPGGFPLVPGTSEAWTERNWAVLEREMAQFGVGVTDYGTIRTWLARNDIDPGSTPLSADLADVYSDLGVDAVIVPGYRGTTAYSPFLIAARIRHSAFLDLKVFAPGGTAPAARVAVEGTSSQWVGPLTLAGGIVAAAGSTEAGWSIAAIGAVGDLLTSFVFQSSSMGKAFDRAIQAGVEQLLAGSFGRPRTTTLIGTEEPGVISGLRAVLDRDEIRIRFGIGEDKMPEAPSCLAAVISDRLGNPLPSDGSHSLGGQVAVAEEVSRLAISVRRSFDLSLPVEALGLTGRRAVGIHELSARIHIWPGRCAMVQTDAPATLVSPPAGFCVRKLAVGFTDCGKPPNGHSPPLKEGR